MPMLVGGMIDDLGFSEQQAGTVAALEGLGILIFFFIIYRTQHPVAPLGVAPLGVDRGAAGDTIVQ